jgi:hypothetical protein
LGHRARKKAARILEAAKGVANRERPHKAGKPFFATSIARSRLRAERMMIAR